jgi:hypothetical protein
MRTICPIGSSFGNSRRASGSLMIATPGPSPDSSSERVNSRPRSIRRPSVLK